MLTDGLWRVPRWLMQTLRLAAPEKVGPGSQQLESINAHPERHASKQLLAQFRLGKIKKRDTDLIF